MKNKKIESVPFIKKLNYIPWNRNWAIVKRHAPIVIKPLLVGLFCSLIWRFIIHRFNLSFDKDAENPILFIIIAFSSFTYAIFAGYAVNAVLSDYKEISKAVVENDVDTFLVYRDEQLPIMMHLLLGIISLFITTFTMLFPYHGTKEGTAAVFSVSFLLFLFYVIVTELDDYYHSIWFKEKIPESWYKIDITEHFKKKNANK